MSRTIRPASAGVILFVTACSGLLAMPAQAATTGTASMSGSQVLFRAASGKQNTVVVSRSGNTVTIDDRVAVKAGAGCAAVAGDVTKVRCANGRVPALVEVYTYDLNDAITNSSGLPMVASGGIGDDSIAGGASWDRLSGDRGRDRIWGGGGNDSLDGSYDADLLSGGAGADSIQDGFGNDVVYGGAGGDLFLGGGGNDVFYGEAGSDVFSPLEPYGDQIRTDADVFSGGADGDIITYGYQRAIVADADGVSRDDGAAGEHDTIRTDVEGVYGGYGNDTLYGTARADALGGGAGNDTIIGNGGDDSLDGGPGADRLYGGAGDDQLDGRDGGSDQKDLLSGGAQGANGDACLRTPGDTVTGCERVTAN